MAALEVGPRAGLAVSGGGDSVALMHLAARLGGRALRVATVDHGLRPAATAEVAAVAAAAAALGLPHETLRPPAPPRPVQAEMREARRALLTDWAGRHGLPVVLTGHTLDDQAETVLMRLSRGGGAEGLAGIPPAPAGSPFRRPLLGIGRAELRRWLRAEGIGWAEDPSNDDPAHERARVRAVLAALGPDAPSAAMLARTARRMGEAAAALDWAARGLARDAVVLSPAGDAAIDRAAIDAVPREVARRVLRIALAAVGRRPERPREAALDRALDAVPGLGGAGLVLAGCRVRPTERRLRVFREPREAARVVLALGGAEGPARWDRRWTVTSGVGTVTSTLAAGLRRPVAAAEAGIADLAWQSLPALVSGGAARPLFPGGGATLLPCDLFAPARPH